MRPDCRAPCSSMLVRLRWIDPNGMLCAARRAGQVAAKAGSSAAAHFAPQPARKVTGYLDRMGFSERRSAGIFEFGTGSSVRRRSVQGLPTCCSRVTPVTRNSDVHEVVDTGPGTRRRNPLEHAELSTGVGCRPVFGYPLGGLPEHHRARRRAGLGRGPGIQLDPQASGPPGGSDRRRRSSAAASARRSKTNTRPGSASAGGTSTALEAAFLLGLTRFPDTGQGTGHSADPKAGGPLGRTPLDPQRNGAHCRHAADGASKSPDLKEGLRALPRRSDQHHSAREDSGELIPRHPPEPSRVRHRRAQRSCEIRLSVAQCGPTSSHVLRAVRFATADRKRCLTGAGSRAPFVSLIDLTRVPRARLQLRR